METIDLKGKFKIEETRLEDKIIKNLTLWKRDIKDRAFYNVTFKNTKLRGITFENTFFSNVVFENSSLKIITIRNSHVGSIKFVDSEVFWLSFVHSDINSIRFLRCPVVLKTTSSSISSLIINDCKDVSASINESHISNLRIVDSKIRILTFDGSVLKEPKILVTSDYDAPIIFFRNSLIIKPKIKAKGIKIKTKGSGVVKDYRERKLT